MQLISFTVENFKSIAEPQTIEFASWPGEASVPNANWSEVTRPVTVLMGSNASGKSNMLDAMLFFARAIHRSATRWQDLEDPGEETFEPFGSRLTNREPSFFELDFVLEGTRYLYGFEYGPDGVAGEWLSYVPSRRWTHIFERFEGGKEPNRAFISTDEETMLKFANSRELYLSVALRSEGFGRLREVADGILSSLNYIPLSEQDKQRRLQNIIGALRSGALDFEEMALLLTAADVGIVGVGLDESRLPLELVEKLRAVADSMETLHKPRGKRSSVTFVDRSGNVIELSEDELEAVALQLIFEHRTEDGVMQLGLSDQSDGTVTWFTLAPQLVEVLRGGGVMLVDELDSNLHPMLLFMVVAAFTEPTVNVGGAQLIFTSHDTNLLERMNELGLGEDAFWFVDKGLDGKTKVYSLDSFRTDSRANYEKRYLSGRYQAVPNLSPSILRGLINQQSVEVATRG